MARYRRISGIVPLCFFLAHWHHHASLGQAEYILWLCNLNNLLLGAGLLLDQPVLFQAGILWLIPTLPLWFIESWEYRDFPVTSVLSHAGSVAFGLLFLKRIGMNRNAWIAAVIWGFGVQLLCRLFTDPALNINVSHDMYPGWKNTFSHYWQFWIFVAAEAVAGLALLSHLLNRRFPPPGP